MSTKCCFEAVWALPIGNAMQSLGLALMVGGMLARGAFTAPAVFGGLPRDLAAPLMATIFTRYDFVLVLALGLVQLGEVLRWSSHTLPAKSRLNLLRFALIAGLTGGIIYSTQVINPQLEQMNRCSGVHRNAATAQGKHFDGLHKTSERFYKFELLAALLLILLTPLVRPVGQGDAATGCTVANVPESSDGSP
jgi:hypothetical protein